MSQQELKLKIVGVSDLGFSSDPNETLITYSLGSCMGVALYDPTAKIGGLIHCLLPQATSGSEDSRHNPFMFVDTGINNMIEAIEELGTLKRRLICKIAGGGAPSGPENTFRIGEKNYAMVRKILFKHNILIKGEFVGGATAKTMMLHINTGRVIVRFNGKEEREL